MNCCNEETACGSEPQTDAGITDCQDIARCFNDCTSPPADSGVDAGSQMECLGLCAGPTSGHTMQGEMDFQALVQCGATNCATQCQ
jgi:hypothetical protein